VLCGCSKRAADCGRIGIGIDPMGNKSLQERALFLVMGLAFLVLGVSALARKDLSYVSGLGQLVFAPAVLLVGLLLVIMAFFKPESIKRKWIQSRKWRRH
jgi:uncharacterized membrane protein HdeD (DUF308 family)